MNNTFSIRRFNEYLWSETRLNMRNYLLMALGIAACTTITFIAADNIYMDQSVVGFMDDNHFNYPMYLMMASTFPVLVAGAFLLSTISKLFSNFHKDGSGSFAMMLPATKSEKFLAHLKLSILLQIAATIIIDIIFIIFCYNQTGEFHSTFFESYPTEISSSVNSSTTWLCIIFLQSTFFLAGVVFKKNAFMKCCGVYAGLLFLSMFISLIFRVSSPIALLTGARFDEETRTIALQIFYSVATVASYAISWILFKRMQIKK